MVMMNLDGMIIISEMEMRPRAPPPMLALPVVSMDSLPSLIQGLAKVPEEGCDIHNYIYVYIYIYK